MRLFFVLLLFLGSISWGIDYEEARHLLSRTGFGGSPEEIDRLLPLTYQEAVEKLLETMNTTATIPPPDFIQNFDPKKDKEFLEVMMPNQRRAYYRMTKKQQRKKRKFINEIMTQEQRMTYRKRMRRQRRARGMELKAWWYREMIATDSPLTEKMTLFWHNHFTSSLKKIKFPYLLYQQNILFRKHATGNFRELTHLITKNPAMVLYLDNQTNRKGKPNENFARELLELFTLGEGNYTEQDIKEAARAFTGWMTDKFTGEFVFNLNQHDEGVKKFMGKSGSFDGNDIVNIVLENPRAAVYITEKLWREFISDKPVKEEVTKLANIFRTNNYEIKPLLKALFNTPSFRKNRGNQIKSPAEFIVGTIRLFKIPVKDTRQLINYGRQLGQDLFDPPNVKGWPGGKNWITSTTLLTRRQFLERSLRGRDHFLKRFWVWHYLEKQKSDEISGLDNWLSLTKMQKIVKIKNILLPIAPVNNIPKNADSLLAIKAMVLDLTYQLK